MKAKLAAVYTKTRANWGKLLKQEQYAELLETNSFLEALKYLNENTRYNMIFPNNQFDQISLDKVEEKFMQFYLSECYKFDYYLQGNYKLIFKILFLKYQLQDIKKVLKIKYKKYNDINQIVFITENCALNKIDFKKILNTETLQEAVEILKDTIYYKSILKLLEEKSESAYFECEMQLDYEYFKFVESAGKKLNRKKADIIGQLSGKYEDLLIIKSIFRQRKYFAIKGGISNVQKKFNGYKLKKDDIKILYEAEDNEQFLKFTEKYKFPKIYNRSLKNKSSIETEISIYMKHLYEAQKKSNNTLVVVMAYFELFMYEIKNIISLLECKEYKVKTDIVERYMI